MKKILVLFILFAVAFSSCKKGEKFDPIAQAAKDEALIKEYVEKNSLDAVRDPSGLYYVVVEPGADITPQKGSAIKVNYTGKLLSGSQFDAGENLMINLTEQTTNQGWMIGVPKIKKGGRVILLIPSGLANGPLETASIPGNSVLVFDIRLLEVDPI